MSAPAPEPAIKSYFFGKGYADLRDTIAESWRRNLASARAEFAKASSLWPGAWSAKALAVLWGSAGVSVILFGTAAFIAFSVVHVAVLLTLFLAIYIGFTVVYSSERCFLTWKRFFTVCPECHSKNPLPEYFCRKCGEVHRRLIPSQYGILHHTCTCGEKLPATFFLNRGDLPTRCPDCQHLLVAGHTESRKTFVPIFGGPSVGKSAFLFSAVSQLIDQAPEFGLRPSFLEARSAGDFERARQQLEQGRSPDKTLASLPRAFNLQLEPDGRDPRVLYLYDPAGEAFNDTAGLVLHGYQQYLSGVVFVVDPFTIPAVREEYADRIAAVLTALKPSALPVEDAFARILIGMEEHFGLGRAARIQQPVAVVINKIDAFDLEQRIGETAVQARIRSSPAAVSIEAARDQLLRDQLVRWDQGDVVQQLEVRCARLHYFTCSSLGRMPDGSSRAFAARGVLEPLLWILREADRAFASPGRRPAA